MFRIVVRRRRRRWLGGRSNLSLPCSRLFCASAARLWRRRRFIRYLGRRGFSRRWLGRCDRSFGSCLLSAAAARFWLRLRLFRGQRLGDRRFVLDRALDHRGTIRFHGGLSRLVLRCTTATTAATPPATLTALTGLFASDFLCKGFRFFALIRSFRSNQVRSFARLSTFAAVAPATSTPATATATATLALAFVSGGPLVGFLILVFDFEGLFLEFFIFLDRRSFSPRLRNGPRSRTVDAHASALEALVDLDVDHYAIALLDVGELSTLLVEDIDGGFLARAKCDAFAAAAGRLVLKNAECG
jgi:hypothetical protein